MTGARDSDLEGLGGELPTAWALDFVASWEGFSLLGSLWRGAGRCGPGQPRTR